MFSYIYSYHTQLFLKKFHNLTRIQDQLIRIVYVYHYDTHLMICIVFPVSQLELVYYIKL